VSACGPGAPTEPLYQYRVFLNWKAPLGNIDHYVLYRAEGDGPMTEFTIVPATDTSVVDGSELTSGGIFTYVIEAVLDDEDATVTPRSNEATITAEIITSIAFQGTDVWMSTSTFNRRYDIKSEILKNGVPVLEKVLSNTTVGLLGFLPLYEQIGSFPNTPVGFAASDTMSVRLSMRVSSSSPGGGSATGAIRLWYNIPGSIVDSHVHATVAGTAVKYYLISGSQLQKNGSVAGPTQSIDKTVGKNTYTEIGTWSRTGS
jgi:hypothetical protein